MAARDEALANSATLRIIMDHHTSPEQAGSIFAEVKPRLAVFTHVILSGEAVSPEELVARTRTKYSGPLEVGKDRMTIDVNRRLFDGEHRLSNDYCARRQKPAGNSDLPRVSLIFLAIDFARPPANFGFEQTAHRLRQGMKNLERGSGLRERLRRAAAQAEC
jgi:hypothetical protein